MHANDDKHCCHEIIDTHFELLAPSKLLLGYLAHKKTSAPRTLQQTHVHGPTVV